MIRTYLRTTALVASLALPFAAFAQNNSTPTSNPDNAGTPRTVPGTSADKTFLHKAAEGGMAEIQFGQLALQKSNSDDVKQFAQKMIDDHTKLNSDMMPFNQKYMVKVPTKLNKKDQAEYSKLNGLSGDAFDKEYIAFMDKDHHMDTRDFTKEVNTTTDTDLKTTVQSRLTVIQQHTQMADQLAQAHNVPVAKPAAGL